MRSSLAPKRLVRFSLFFLALSGLIILVSAISAKRVEVVFFSNALRDARIDETVSVRGVSYRVSLGTVANEKGSVTGATERAALRLAYEKSAARNNPLLALPDTDIDMFRDAVSALRATASQLAAKQTRSNQIFSVQHALYPTGFLEELANLEVARRQFLATGGEVDAKRYRIQIVHTIHAFQRDRTAFEYAFKKAVALDAPSFATPQSIVSRDDFVHVLSQLEEIADSIEKVVRQRTACFHGHVSACLSTDILLPELQITSVTPIRPETLTIAKRTIDIFEQSGDRFTSSQLLLFPDSTCKPRNSRSAALFSLRDNGDGALPSPLFVGDILFVESAPYEGLPYVGYFAAHHIPYVYMSSLSYYECVGAQGDLGTVIASYAVKEFALRQVLSARASGNLSAELKRLEDTFASAHIISTTDVKTYLTYTRTLSESSDFPKPLSDDIHSLWLRMHTKSDGILGVMRDINTYETKHLHFPPEAALNFDATYLFFARSGFLSLVPDSLRIKSVDAGHIFPANTLPSDVQPYALLSELSKDELSTTDAISYMRFFRTFDLDRK